jgi:hypothetical protein
VDDGRHAAEEPVVRAVADEVDALGDFVAAHAAPALGEDDADAGDPNGVEDEVGQGCGVVDDDGAEADVDWWRACFEEGGEVGRWGV